MAGGGTAGTGSAPAPGVFGLRGIFLLCGVFGLRQALGRLRWVFRQELADLGPGDGRALVVARNLIPRRSFILIRIHYVIRFVRFGRRLFLAGRQAGVPG